MCILPISVFQGNGFFWDSQNPSLYTVGGKDTFWSMNGYFLAPFRVFFSTFPEHFFNIVVSVLKSHEKKRNIKFFECKRKNSLIDQFLGLRT